MNNVAISMLAFLSYCHGGPVTHPDMKTDCGKSEVEYLTREGLVKETNGYLEVTERGYTYLSRIRQIELPKQMWGYDDWTP